MNSLLQVKKNVQLHRTGEWRGTRRMIKERFSLGRSQSVYFIRESKEYAHSQGLLFAYDRNLGTFNCTDDEDTKRRLLRDATKNSISQQRSLKLHMMTAFETDVITSELYVQFLNNYKSQNKLLEEIG